MVEFKKIAELFQEIEDTPSRLEMMSVLGEFYKDLAPEEAAILSYMLLGRLAPMFVSAEFNFSDKGVENALASVVLIGKLELDVVELRKSLGDIGLVAERVSETIGSNSNDSTDLVVIYRKLWELLNVSGGSSVDIKSGKYIELFNSLDPVSNKYLAKIISGKMRLGASVSTILEALSYSQVEDKSMVGDLKQSYGAFADIGVLSHRVVGGAKLSDIEAVTLGIPVKARLVERVKSFEEVFERLGEEVIVQPKFDGLRCQAHVGVNADDLKKQLSGALWIEYYNSVKDQDAEIDMFAAAGSVVEDGDKVQLFSRNLENLTDMFPEVVEALSGLDCKSCILDGEIEGVDPETGKFLNFQETITRKRKHGVEEAVNGVPVKYYVFDIISLDGRDLTEVDTSERIEILKELMKSKPDLIEVADTWNVKDIDTLNDYFESSVGEGLEGLVVKQFDGGYRPGVRNYEWIKLKKSMDKGLVDSVDVVVMGYYYGSGKQAELGIGALLGGILNDKTGEIESITKIGTGVTDELWRTIIIRLDSLKSESKPINYSVANEMVPDVWVVPEIVCSVEADEVTKSKLHRAGGNSDKEGLGLALRFPRLVEFDRDKSVEDTTAFEELISMNVG
jgi:DNA ligase 1